MVIAVALTSIFTETHSYTITNEYGMLSLDSQSMNRNQDKQKLSTYDNTGVSAPDPISLTRHDRVFRINVGEDVRIRAFCAPIGEVAIALFKSALATFPPANVHGTYS